MLPISEGVPPGPIDDLSDEELTFRVEWAFAPRDAASYTRGLQLATACVLWVSEASARAAASGVLDGLEAAGCPANRVAVMRQLGRD
jgi:hypothetical protein